MLNNKVGGGGEEEEEESVFTIMTIYGTTYGCKFSPFVIFSYYLKYTSISWEQFGKNYVKSIKIHKAYVICCIFQFSSPPML